VLTGKLWWLEPLWLVGGSIITFYGLTWLLEKIADVLGVEEEEDWD
jgi:hypothetical protein